MEMMGGFFLSTPFQSGPSANMTPLQSIHEQNEHNERECEQVDEVVTSCPI